MASIRDFASRIGGFYRKSQVEQLLDLAWFLEANAGLERFDGARMRQAFHEAGLEPPDMSVYLPRLAAKKPPQLIRQKTGYRLTGGLRRDLDQRYGEEPTFAAISLILADLPRQIPDLAERVFLTEALNCYRVAAYRAAIIMVWNLAYDHLARWIIADAKHLQALNAAIATRFPKKRLLVSKLEHLDDLKESELIEACRTGALLDKNTITILRDKLARRNAAAHPSRVAITQHQADDAISDLVLNVILMLR